MPLYEYQCQACGKRFEVIQKFSDAPADVCRVCGKGPVERLLSSPAIQFKGTGWYITDYSQKGKASSSESGSSSSGSGGSGSSSADAKGSAAAKDDSASSKPAPAAPASTTKTEGSS